MQPVDAQDEVGPAGAGPLIQRLVVEQRVELFQEPRHGGNDALVAGRFLPLRENLEDDESRPDIALRRVPVDRPEPAVVALCLEDVVDPVPGPILELFVIEQDGQRQKTIEPVRAALPAVALAAVPGAVANVGPELIEVAAQPIRLDAKLAAQPAGRPHLAQRQRPQRQRPQSRLARRLLGARGREKGMNAQAAQAGQESAPVEAAGEIIIGAAAHRWCLKLSETGYRALLFS